MYLSPFPHSLSITSFSPFPLHFLILSPFSRSQAARLTQFVQPCIVRYKFSLTHNYSHLLPFPEHPLNCCGNKGRKRWEELRANSCCLIVRGCFKDLLFPNITSPFAQIPLFPISDDFCAAKCISTITPTTPINSTVCPFNWLQLVTVTFKVHNETLCWNA